MHSLHTPRFAFKISVAVFGTGLLVSSAVIWTAKREGYRLSQRFLEQTHRDTVRILDRDVDELRRQMRNVIGTDALDGMVNDVGPLYFQMNARGTLGLRGMNFPQTWVPIQNAGASAFRAAFPPSKALAAEIRDEHGTILDTNHAERPSRDQIESTIEGTNLHLYSASLKTPVGAGNWFLLTLLPLTWAAVAFGINKFLRAQKTRVQLVHVKEEEDEDQMIQINLRTEVLEDDPDAYGPKIEVAGTSPLMRRPACLTPEERLAMTSKIFPKSRVEDERRFEMSDSTFI